MLLSIFVSPPFDQQGQPQTVAGLEKVRKNRLLAGEDVCRRDHSGDDRQKIQSAHLLLCSLIDQFHLFRFETRHIRHNRHMLDFKKEHMGKAIFDISTFNLRRILHPLDRLFNSQHRIEQAVS